MALLRLIKSKIKQKQNYKIAKEIVNLDIKSSCIAYEKPKLPELTQEEIDDIHARGKITAAEKVKEWESWDLCAPGDAIGSAAWRCRKFRHNCHDCLVDYASDRKEYESFRSILSKCNSFSLGFCGSLEDTEEKKMQKVKTLKTK